jgi:hypothetical protein
VEAIEKRIPRERYLLGFPLGGGTKPNGAYLVYIGAKVYLGEADGRLTEKLQRVKSLFAKGDIQSDIPVISFICSGLATRQRSGFRQVWPNPATSPLF